MKSCPNGFTMMCRVDLSSRLPCTSTSQNCKSWKHQWIHRESRLSCSLHWSWPKQPNHASFPLQQYLQQMYYLLHWCICKFIAWKQFPFFQFHCDIYLSIPLWFWLIHPLNIQTACSQFFVFLPFHDFSVSFKKKLRVDVLTLNIILVMAVIEASNALQAWKTLEDLTNHIDLVLTEVVMPCLSGIGLLCKIMSHKTRKNVPVISKLSYHAFNWLY